MIENIAQFRTGVDEFSCMAAIWFKDNYNGAASSFATLQKWLIENCKSDVLMMRCENITHLHSPIVKTFLGEEKNLVVTQHKFHALILFESKEDATAMALIFKK